MGEVACSSVRELAPNARGTSAMALVCRDKHPAVEHIAVVVVQDSPVALPGIIISAHATSPIGHETTRNANLHLADGVGSR